jgi:hypothetical protein
MIEVFPDHSRGSARQQSCARFCEHIKVYIENEFIVLNRREREVYEVRRSVKCQKIALVTLGAQFSRKHCHFLNDPPSSPVHDLGTVQLILTGANHRKVAKCLR